MPAPPVDVLVIGADSLIGGAVHARMQAAGRPVAGTTRRAGNDRFLHLDLSGDFQTAALPAAQAVLLAAAETSTARCREDPRGTRRINVAAAGRLADWAKQSGARPILLSTTAVFDGATPFEAESAARRPVGVYGEQKAAAEEQVLDNAGAIVLRLGKVLHADQPLIVGWREALAAGRPIHPFADMVMAPVSLADAVEAIARLLDAPRAAGIFQLTADRDMTYAEAAALVAARSGAAPERVVPTTSRRAGITVDHLPRHATLSDERLRALTGLAAPPPEKAVIAALGAR